MIFAQGKPTLSLALHAAGVVVCENGISKGCELFYLFHIRQVAASHTVLKNNQSFSGFFTVEVERAL